MTRSVIDKVPLCAGGHLRASLTPSSVSLTDKDVKVGSRGVGTGQAIIKTISGHEIVEVEMVAVTEMIVNLQIVG